MSIKKTKANGAEPAPIPTILEEATVTPTKKSNGKRPQNSTKFFPSELDGLIDQRQLLGVLVEVKNGNFAVRVPNDQIGVTGKIYDTLNEIIALNEILVQELSQARKIIGKQGKLNHRVELPRLAGGSWSTAVDSINSLIS
ncbi:MAG: hypothetical protein ACTHOF_05130, partial [Flavisolibacter sp.]